jgi:Arc/MetJ-type ribon-helix-helix transcriptional regulator
MTVQIAVKLPDELVAAVDGLVDEGRFASRSTAVRRAIEELVRAERRRAVDEAFRQGFRRHPDDGAELAQAHELAAVTIADEPWERWW